MSGMRLKIQCVKNVDHAKILRFGSLISFEEVDRLGGLMCGTSPLYIHRPGAGSLIGKCALCGGQLEYEVQEIEEKQGSVIGDQGSEKP
jgi:hypothetical protein